MTYYQPPAPGEPMPPVPGYPPGGYAPPPPPRSNGAAIASLVLGILGCVPLITGLLAIPFGIVGIRRGRQPNTGGTGMAVAGLTLGIISVLFWCTCVGFTSVLYVHSGPARSVARQYIQDLSSNNLAAASANASSHISPGQFQDQRNQIARWGTLNDIRFVGMYYNTLNGASTWRLNGVASFTSAPHPFEIVLIEENGRWKVQRLQFQ